jgi:hypothetical protein
MKYFIDHEFLEGPQKEKFPISLFRKQTPNTIDLISIGIVAEDGREYYAISKDFNLKEAWNRYDEKVEIMSGDIRNRFPEGRQYKEYWIRENVLNTIFMEFLNLERGYLETQKRIVGYAPCINSEFCYSNFKRLLGKYGKTNKQITEDIIKFTLDVEVIHPINDYVTTPIEFYAYFGDYDWVVFCWLFGKMIDLPNGFPKYCKDLKQIMDKHAEEIVSQFEDYPITEQGRKNILRSVPGQIKAFKEFDNWPKQDPSKSHNAIEDARWNKQLFDFLNTP